MRENYETSLAVVKILAADPSYPVGANTPNAILDKLGYEYARQQEVTASVVYLHQRGLLDGKVNHQPLLNGPAVVTVVVYGLSARGQEYLRNVEAEGGKWFREALRGMLPPGYPVKVTTPPRDGDRCERLVVVFKCRWT